MVCWWKVSLCYCNSFSLAKDIDQHIHYRVFMLFNDLTRRWWVVYSGFYVFIFSVMEGFICSFQPLFCILGKVFEHLPNYWHRNNFSAAWAQADKSVENVWDTLYGCKSNKPLNESIQNGLAQRNTMETHYFGWTILSFQAKRKFQLLKNFSIWNIITTFICIDGIIFRSCNAWVKWNASKQRKRLSLYTEFE